MFIFKFVKRNKNIATLVAILSVLIIFTSFNDDNNFKLAKNMEIFYDIMRDLDLYYVDKIDVEKRMNIGIKDMLKTLDPYTVYYPESQMEEFRLMTTGQYGGIGAIMRLRDKQVVIDEIFENYPAHKAGLKVGDIITSVAGKTSNSENYDEVSELIKGMPDTEIEIGVYRASDNKNYTKRLVRARIVNKSVDYYDMLSDQTGYIKLSGFSNDAYTLMKEALLNLKNKNAQKLIIDLRNNPGGLLIQAVKIVSLFVKEGTLVVSTRGKLKTSNSTFKTHDKPVDTEIPIVVLVNSNSASAAEIVSGALQDLDRAVVIGGRTFGKGLVQTTKDLSYNAKMKITTAKYYIPSGRCIQALDYSHRNADGSVGYVPDSLISEFKTLNGRIVYDGGGIKPDKKIAKKENSPISRYLYENMIIFDFATKYAATHPTIDSAKSFNISQESFNKFVEFAMSKNIKYQTETDKLVEQLSKVAKKEGYYDKAKAEIASLKKSLSHSAKDDIIFFEKQIKNMLNLEIIKRYYFQKGVVEHKLADDELINMAISILNNNKEYNDILTP